jgi:hypothetical protein
MTPSGFFSFRILILQSRSVSGSQKLIQGANFKTFQFGQGQGGQIFQPEEYIEYFED